MNNPDASARRRIFILAGEASGDLHASNLVSAIRSQNPLIKFEGLGGQKMAAAGVSIRKNIVEDLAIIGFAAVIKHLPELKALMQSVVTRLRDTRPDAVLLVDYPGFNLRVARQAKKLGLPVIYYICPQTWAWHESRAQEFPKILDKMLTIFPFEEGLFRGYGANATFVGHPLLDLMQVTMARREVCETFGLDANRPILSILPGSRRSEIEHLLPVMMDAAAQLRRRIPEMQFVLPKAETVRRSMIEQIASRYDVPLVVVEKTGYNVRAAADFAWVASGTATLETALLGVPMVIVYKTSWATAAIARRLVRLPYIGLANIVAEKQIVPELVQEDATARNLLDQTLAIWNNDQKMRTMKEELHRVKEKLDPAEKCGLRKTGYDRAAEEVLSFLKVEDH